MFLSVEFKAHKTNTIRTLSGFSTIEQHIEIDDMVQLNSRTNRLNGYMVRFHTSDN